MGHPYSATRPRMCAAIIRLPFLADDLFVNFDDERSEAGVRVLAELAKYTQVLFFTHHPTSRRSRVRQLVLTLSQSARWLEIGKESGECRFSAKSCPSANGSGTAEMSQCRSIGAADDAFECRAAIRAAIFYLKRRLLRRRWSSARRRLASLFLKDRSDMMQDDT